MLTLSGSGAFEQSPHSTSTPSDAIKLVGAKFGHFIASLTKMVSLDLVPVSGWVAILENGCFLASVHAPEFGTE